MREAFVASLVWEGTQGGGLYADDIGLIFAAQKLTMPEYLKLIKMPYRDMRIVRCCRAFVFPAVEITMKSGEVHELIVFERRRILQILKSKNVLIVK